MTAKKTKQITASGIDVHCAHSAIVDIEQLVPNPRNPNTHGDKQIALLAKIIRNQGWRNPVVISNRSGFIVKGHGRLEAAKLLNVAQVPIDAQDYESEAAEYADLIADNRIAELAEINDSSIKGLLEDDMFDDFDMDLTGFDSEELGKIGVGESVKEGFTDEDEVPDPPDKAKSRRGQVWTLGEHRLMCGDSTCKEDVEKLMGGNLADMVLTDPPYGVAYVGKTKDALTIESDDCSEEQLREYCKAWFDNAEHACRSGAYWIATVPARPLHEVFLSDWKSRGILRQVMVWVKDSMVLGHSEYHYRHEPILFGWIPGGERLKNTDRKKTTVWEFDRPKRSAEHPTMKPVGMWCYAMQQHTKNGDIVYEPFSGSGTTHIAAEQLGRSCYGMELDPKYCDVIIKRWEDFTGRKAVLVNDS